jgi:hypothetical protein
MPKLEGLSEKETPNTTKSLIKNLLKHVIPVHRLYLQSFVDFNKWILYGCGSEQIKPFELRSDLKIHKMTHGDLEALTSGTGRFSDQAKLYYAARGIDAAYGAYLNGELVHMSWVYTAAEYAKEPFERLILNENEVEIVNCFTTEKCRGLRIFPYVIQFLSHLYFQNGTKQVYMMADHKNLASQRGIVNAGLKPLGQVTYVRIPRTANRSIYYRRSPFESY